MIISPTEGKKMEDSTPMPTAEEAIMRLKEGNERFVSEQLLHPHEQKSWREKLESGQAPFAVILGCSDSRVIPELIFDQGLGDLFVVRVAGNVVGVDVTASVEYAVDHCGSPLVVVMGHSKCGAITATLDHFHDPGTEPAEVVELMNRLEPAVMNLPEEETRDAKIERAVRRNVELSVRRLARVPDLAKGQREGRVKVVGAIYDLHTGKVEFL
ncbi:MAG: carbonic anhydrase [Verrucomicrobiota bacterium]